MLVLSSGARTAAAYDAARSRSEATRVSLSAASSVRRTGMPRVRSGDQSAASPGSAPATAALLDESEHGRR
jgi:hypothetical protein